VSLASLWEIDVRLGWRQIFDGLEAPSVLPIARDHQT
jgi:hypothetical protein